MTEDETTHTDTECYSIEKNVDQQGVNPDDLTFRFLCQWCGLRCCWQSGLDTVTFLPHSFAYIVNTFPNEVVQHAFDSGMLEWVSPPLSIPHIKINFFVCPFLMLHFDRAIQTQFTTLLIQKAETLEYSLQLYLAYILRRLIFNYEAYLGERNHANPSDLIMYFPVHALIGESNTVWQRLLEEDPSLFKSKNESDYIRTLFQFLRHPRGDTLQKDEPLFQASCGIYPARPLVCRVHPLIRRTVSNEQTVMVNPQTACPSIAFERGEEMTATQYLQQQDADSAAEIALLDHVETFLDQQAEVLSGFTPELLTTFYKNLIYILYFSVPYQENRSHFYFDLIVHLFKISEMDFLELDSILTQHYPFYRPNEWIIRELDETNEEAFENECDNFPVQYQDITLHLEAVFIVLPQKQLFLIEAYTTLFEGFPNPSDPATITEAEFLAKLANEPSFAAELIKQYTDNHPLTPTSPQEIEQIYRVWRSTQVTHGGEGWLVFPEAIRQQIVHHVQTQLASTSWRVLMLEEYLGYV